MVYRSESVVFRREGVVFHSEGGVCRSGSGMLQRGVQSLRGMSHKTWGVWLLWWVGDYMGKIGGVKGGASAIWGA